MGILLKYPLFTGRDLFTILIDENENGINDIYNVGTIAFIFRNCQIKEKDLIRSI